MHFSRSSLPSKLLTSSESLRGSKSTTLNCPFNNEEFWSLIKGGNQFGVGAFNIFGSNLGSWLISLNDIDSFYSKYLNYL